MQAKANGDNQIPKKRPSRRLSTKASNSAENKKNKACIAGACRTDLRRPDFISASSPSFKADYLAMTRPFMQQQLPPKQFPAPALQWHPWLFWFCRHAKACGTDHTDNPDASPIDAQRNARGICSKAWSSAFCFQRNAPASRRGSGTIPTHHLQRLGRPAPDKVCMPSLRLRYRKFWRSPADTCEY